MLTREEWRAQDLVGLAGLVARKEIAPRDALLTAIREIEALNPALNAVVVTRFEEALSALDAAEAAGGERPRFHGMPWLAKDLHAPVKGLPLANGSRRFHGQTHDFDSTTFARMRAAGFAMLGRTNSPEFGLSVSTEPALWGPARNPWDRNRSAGGSSGGAAAAVGSGMLPAAHATDSAGSIRAPAANCGVVGFKPTRGVNALGPHRGDPNFGISHEHAVARSVRDSAAILDVTAGPDVGAPWFTKTPDEPFERLIERPPARLRIGFTTRTLAGDPVHPDCAAAAEAMARLLAEMGHEVEEATPDFDAKRLTDATIRLLMGSLAGLFPGGAGDGEGLEPMTRAALAFAARTTLGEHLARSAVMNVEVRRLAAFWTGHDILVTPAMATPPVPLGVLDTSGDDLEAFLDTLFGICPFTAPFNASGQPAISLPFGRSAEGLPVGVQLVGRFGADATVLALSHAIEMARSWAEPPVGR